MDFFPLFFVAFWISITVLLGFVSGWYTLMKRFPDRGETARVTLRAQSGSVGAVRMNGILKLEACPSGLRVGILRVFGPFSRAFFVPWDQISVQRRKSFFQPVAELNIGTPSLGKLVLPDYVANRFAREVPECWPETEAPPAPARRAVVGNVFRIWAVQTAFASAFFLIIPRVVGPEVPHPPVAVAIAFPAVAFGLVALVRYARGRGP